MPILNEEDSAAAPPPGRDPYSAFRIPGYRLYAGGNFLAILGRQMLNMAVGYEVYLRTHSKFALGLIGLVGALPIIFLALPAGQLADRLSRRGIIMGTQFLSLLASVALAWVSWHVADVAHWPAAQQLSAGLHWMTGLFGKQEAFGPEIPLYLALLLIGGAARTFGWAARPPFIANLVPRQTLANATTWNSSLFEVGCVVGPTIGGLLLKHFDYGFIYLTDACASLLYVFFLLCIRQPFKAEPRGTGHPVAELFAGLRFVRDTKVILATITLDLFAVLLGGATALLPVFTEEILHVGPDGLGRLRGAQSLGAIAMAFALAHLRPMRQAGAALCWAVAGFGLATIVFGLSRNFWLSFLALAVAGACDNISVVVRHTLVQLMTPDAMRGRVAAVNNIFIGSSNELGAFESGLTAAWFGPVISVVAGGIGTILVVGLVIAKWPQILRIGSLEGMKPAPVSTA
ncbi:MAG TPA: MFS transporter [Chthoniobacteraceae bacterium]|nr:MFS transporter [Chthoniobacteraceae bacterium]